MELFNTITKKSGQHTIEYAVLLILIMAGIIVAGPYVIRSWNANLKGWEDSVVDSLQDPLIEAPDNAVTITGCDPGDWDDVGCHEGITDPCTGENFSCSEVERTWRQLDARCVCDIPNHPPIVKCTVDDCCCTEPTPTGRCGAQATVVTGLTEPACNTAMTPKNADGTCPDGMMESWVLCGHDVYDESAGTDERRFGCVPDPECVFECTSPPFVPETPEYGPLCPGDSSGLTGDVPNSFVEYGKCTDKKCETQCAEGFPLNEDGTACACLGGIYGRKAECDAIATVTCPEGSILISGGLAINPSGKSHCTSDEDAIWWIDSYPEGCGRYRDSVGSGCPSSPPSPTGSGWSCGGDDYYANCYAICYGCIEEMDVKYVNGTNGDIISCPAGYHVISGTMDASHHEEGGVRWIESMPNAVDGTVNATGWVCKSSDSLKCTALCSNVPTLIKTGEAQFTGDLTGFAECPQGYRLLGGGIKAHSGSHSIWQFVSRPDVANNRWICGASGHQATCYAVCGPE